MPLPGAEGRAPEIDRLEPNLREPDEAVAHEGRDRCAEPVREFHDLLVKGAEDHKWEARHRTLTNRLAYAPPPKASLSRSGRPLSS